MTLPAKTKQTRMRPKAPIQTAPRDERAVNNPAAPLHVTGRARFIRDESRPAGLCFAVVLPSPHAHARILSLDVTSAQQIPGVAAILTAADIPGEKYVNAKSQDEPILPENEVTYVGQPVAVVVAETEKAAEAGRDAIRAEYEALPAILTITDALQARSFLGPEFKVARGNAVKALTCAEHVLEGTVQSGAQEHVYFETQCARAIPGEDQEMTLYSATQAPSEVQEVVAHMLGLRRKDITVDVKRIGGGFGGKESLATLWACLAALSSYRTRRPVELKLPRIDDMAWTGKRHPFESHYRVGFDPKGIIQAYQVEMNANGGAYIDLTFPILHRAIVHAENAYYIPDIHIVARPCRTNLPPNTAFRGFGAPQGIFIIESVIERIAHHLGLDPLEVRKRNAYREGQKTPYGQTLHEVKAEAHLKQLEKVTHYASLRQEVNQFNATHRYVKRGIGIVPVKFGISFNAPHLNQGNALVMVYADGSVSVSHGGIEMGQEVNTKVAQVVAGELGLTLDRIRIESHNTKRTPNTSPTAASTGADLNGAAALDAARQIRERLVPLALELLSQGDRRPADAKRLLFEKNEVFDAKRPATKLSFAELAEAAWRARIDLGAHGFFKTPGLKFDWKTGRGTPFRYFVYGSALAVAEVDILTGMVTLPMVHIIHETASSINPAIDRGQIEGAFMQGFGWCTMEDVVVDEQGRNLSHSLSTYKIPTILDLPLEWTIDMIESSRKYAGIRGSKAVGEPPLIYGEAAFFAIKHAIESIVDHKIEATLRHPATPEAILMAVEALQKRPVRS
jgi:xanthine dehydrogenase large subunit